MSQTQLHVGRIPRLSIELFDRERVSHRLNCTWGGFRGYPWSYLIGRLALAMCFNKDQEGACTLLDDLKNTRFIEWKFFYLYRSLISAFILWILVVCFIFLAQLIGLKTSLPLLSRDNNIASKIVVAHLDGLFSCIDFDQMKTRGYSFNKQIF